MCLRAGDSAPRGTLMLHRSKRPPQAARSCGEEKMFVRNSRLSPIPPRGGAAQTAALHGKPNWSSVKKAVGVLRRVWERRGTRYAGPREPPREGRTKP